LSSERLVSIDGSAADFFDKSQIMNKTIGIVLVVVGLVGLAWGGFTYTTTEKVVDIGPIHATHEKTHNVPLPPIAGGLALAAGIVLLIASRPAAA
jgi:hypothetical protein